ncbi:phosphatase PAP2 family protein [Nocardia sp. 2YAB30]|uniref:phosphatase PAP2 family protein n=1 Tax=unclassified Nocardia TaxID=2637762 RepID=UPI003F9E9C58
MTTPTIAALDVNGLGDEQLRQINAFARHTPWLRAVMYDYATYGVVLFAALLIAGWWLARRSGDPARMAAAIWAGVATVLAVGVNQPLVHAVGEQRPYDAVPGLLVLADRSTDPSFPSDHATMAGAAAAGLFLVSPRLGKAAVAAALLMAFARVYIAAHYPHDVIAGLVLGAAVTLIGWVLIRRGLTAVVLRATHSRLRPVLAAPRARVQRAAQAMSRM